MPYVVMVDDNFHYQDESERYQHRTFRRLDSAERACRRIIDEDLKTHLKPGIKAGELYDLYTMFDRDPYIIAPAGAPQAIFSARKYAEERCRILAKQSQPKWWRFWR